MSTLSISKRIQKTIVLLIISAFMLLPLLAQSEEAILPDALPEIAGEGTFEETFQLASNDLDEGVFEFAELAQDKWDVVMPEELAPEPEQKVVSNLSLEENWEEQIRVALIAKGAGEQIAVDSVRFGRNLKEAKANPSAWQVQDVVFDRNRSLFSGKLISEGKPYVKFRGRYGAMEMVPVLLSKLERGAKIRAEDLTMKPILALRVRNRSTITELEQVVGKTLKRVKAIGQPIRVTDLVEEVSIIKPNSEVKMVYSHGGVHLVDRGIALERGAEGEVIRVRNSKSGAVLRGKITSSRTVLVSYLEDPKEVAYAH